MAFSFNKLCLNATNNYPSVPFTIFDYNDKYLLFSGLTMLHFTIRQLQIFEAVARHLSYSRAAEELHLTQPAVSMQMRELEANVGLAMLEQIGKKIFLTEAGEELHGRSRDILVRLAETRTALETMKGVDHGRLNIAVVSTAKYFAPKLLALFCKRYQNVKLQLTVSNREEVLNRLTENQTDLAIMGQPPDGLDAEKEAFAYHPLSIIAPPDHALAKAKQIPLYALMKETFLIREPGSGTRNVFERLLTTHRLQAERTLQMDSNETIKQAVMAGMGIALLSLHTIGLESEAKRLIVLDVESLPVMRRWYIAHRSGKRLSPAAIAFRQFLLEEGAVLLGQVRSDIKDAPRQKASGKRLSGKSVRGGKLGAARGKAGT
jgi:LysR family transcriptional regulator, low CO2-responsive transcriptional regulator